MNSIQNIEKLISRFSQKNIPKGFGECLMEFCKKCGNIMKVVKGRKRTMLGCSCGYKIILKGKKKAVITRKVPKKKNDIVIMKKGDESIELPKTKEMCPKCENMEAYWWMQQTRSSDEPPTRFYKCTKCGYSWRNYE